MRDEVVCAEESDLCDRYLDLFVAVIEQCNVDTGRNRARQPLKPTAQDAAEARAFLAWARENLA